jgi:hypothetical protein
MTEHKTRTDVAVAWVGWHLGELAGVGVPLLLAATVSGWFALLAAVVAAAWVAHEITHTRTQRAARRATEQPQVGGRPARKHVTGTATGEEGSHEQHLA